MDSISNDSEKSDAAGHGARTPLVPSDNTDSHSTPLLSVDAKSLDEPLRVDKITALNSSADADGVRWAGECNVLAEDEKATFVSQLAMLGYSPQEFQVTVRPMLSKGPEDVHKRYSVTVVQSWNRMPFRGKRYVGGHDAEWVKEFSRNSLATRRPPSRPFSTQAGTKQAKRNRPLGLIRPR